ncbi:MAG: DNA mismatch endonuclease Vsr [Planctomycetaceae bacterium]|nr:DNA mismatch endonuclease Vsr [Planctomycetaceae bacterium]
MVDVHNSEQRSFNMSRIRSKDTKPEIIVRSVVHRLGYRFRLHRRDLPGKPDLVLPRHGRIIFVHGCFWHMHRCRYGRVVPATNTEFWQTKRSENVKRDQRNRKQLRHAGWKVLTVWECWTKDVPGLLIPRLVDFLSENDSPPSPECSGEPVST